MARELDMRRDNGRHCACHFRCTAHVTNVCEVDAMLVDAGHSIAVGHGRCSIFAAGTRHLAYQ